MNILYVVSRPLEINSSASLRNINTINGLCELGCSVTVATGYPDINHPQYSKIILNDSAKQLYAVPNIGKHVSAKFSYNHFLKKIRSLVYRYYSSHNIYDSWKYVAGDKIWESLAQERFDLIISSSDPKSSHLAAEKFLKFCQIPWIQIWGDPFAGDITNGNRSFEKQRQREEQRLLEMASKAVFLSELTAMEMKEKYPDFKDKISFMPRPYIKAKVGRSKDFKGEALRLAYCGDYNSSVRNIMPLYEAAKKTKDTMVILGNSDLALENSSEIQVKGRVSADIVEQIEDAADVLVHLSNLTGSQIPGKIYNYSATDKPILFILDGEKAKIKSCFEKYDRYLFCDNTSEDIEKALDIIRSGRYPGKMNPVPDFSYEVVLKNLISI